MANGYDAKLIKNDCPIYIFAEFPKIYFLYLCYILKKFNLNYKLIMFNNIFTYPKYNEIEVANIIYQKFKDDTILFVDDSLQYIRAVSNMPNAYVCNFKTYLTVLNKKGINHELESI